MAKKGYFNDSLKKSCSYCFYGTMSKTGNNILCEKAGLVSLDGEPCKKYIYDPIKRVPQAQIEKLEKYAEAIEANEQRRIERARKHGYKIEDVF